MSSNTVDNAFFARFWTFMSAHEPESVRAWRREVLAGVSGRVLEVGAGTGTNFALYPDSVKEVVALEPERRLTPIARKAALSAPVPVTVCDTTIESLDAGEPFDAVVCSLVLCSVDQAEAVLQQIFSICDPAASSVIWSTSPALALADGCSGWPTRRCGPGCSATVIRTATPSARSPMPAFGPRPRGTTWSSRPGCRCRSPRW